MNFHPLKRFAERISSRHEAGKEVNFGVFHRLPSPLGCNAEYRCFWGYHWEPKLELYLWYVQLDFRTQHNFATFWISMEPWSQWKQSQVLADPKDAEAVATAMVLTNFLKPKLLTTNLPPPSLLLEGSKARVQSGSKTWKVEFYWNLASTPAMFGYVWIW